MTYRRPALRQAAFVVLAVVTTLIFSALGIWQVERRAWKLDLIAQVDARIHLPPAAAPGPAAWPEISVQHDAYRHITAQGIYLAAQETLVQASTVLGAGYWVITPLQRPDSSIILVNRGFIPAALRDAAPHDPVTGTTSVTGLLRLTEPQGRWPRTNDPAANRWYSRDVAAIAQAQRLANVAPYFIDADLGTDAQSFPRGGLTVISFSNNHLIYALTWFALAGLSLFAGYRVVHDKAAAKVSE